MSVAGVQVTGISSTTVRIIGRDLGGESGGYCSGNCSSSGSDGGFQLEIGPSSLGTENGLSVTVVAIARGEAVLQISKASQ
jgi:hypothetical protein